MKRLLLLLTQFLLLSPAHAATLPEFPAHLPASYEREVPGANSLIRWHLDLLFEGRYRLRMTYLDKPEPNQFDQVGQWRYDHDKVTLFQDTEPPWRFGVEAGGDLLRQLDSAGKPIESVHDAPLRRLPEPALIEPHLEPGYVPLRGTDWKLVQLEGKPVEAADRQREPHLLFATETQRVSGSGGCNRIMGGFDLDGDTLHLPQMARTMMACLSGMERENRFLQSLGKVARYRIGDGHLEMLDTSGTVLMRFEAVPLLH